MSAVDELNRRSEQIAREARKRLLAQIEEQLAARRREIESATSETERLLAARAVLADEEPAAPAEAARNGAKRNGASSRSKSRAKRARPAARALELIAASPGIETRALAAEIGTNAYRITKRLHAADTIEPCAQGWQLKAVSP